MTLSYYLYPFPDFIFLVEMGSGNEHFYVRVHRLLIHLSEFLKELKRMKEFID